MNETEAKTNDGVGVEPAIEAMAKMRRQSAFFETNWIACLDGTIPGSKPHPRIIRCERHKFDRRIDVEESCRVSWREDEFRCVYESCPACDRSRLVASRSEWLSRAGVPADVLAASFESFTIETLEDANNLQSVREYAATSRGTLIMAGANGRGKTHLAVAVMREVGCGMLITHMTLIERIERIRKTYGNDRVVDPVDRCKRARLLVLDEAGASPGGRNDWPALHSIMHHRSSERLPTVLTSNLSVVELKDLLGARIWDRVRPGRLLSFTGPSRRV